MGLATVQYSQHFGDRNISISNQKFEQGWRTKAAHIPFDRSRLGTVDVLNFKDNLPETLVLMPKLGGSY